MNFWIFMLCMLAAIFAGMILDRVMVLKKALKDYKYWDLSFENEEDAKSLLESIGLILETYEKVRVFDLYKLAELDATSQDKYFGWTSIDEFTIEHAPNGRWIVRVPEPKFL